jgi:hypothetical protein
MITFFERSLWLSILLLVCLVVLLFSTFGKLGGRMPSLKTVQDRASPPHRPVIDPRVLKCFASDSCTRLAPGTNTVNPFFTLFFQPPPPPPPPPTKKVELLYQGFLTTSGGTQLAYVLNSGALMILTNGAKVIADHAIKEIGPRGLVLTNAAGQTNVLEFNVKRAIDVPST